MKILKNNVMKLKLNILSIIKPSKTRKCMVNMIIFFLLNSFFILTDNLHREQ